MLDVINNMSKACGFDIQYQIMPRKCGDISSCYCDPKKAKEEIGFIAQYGIKEMCEHAWNWQKKNPNGYEE